MKCQKTLRLILKGGKSHPSINLSEVCHCCMLRLASERTEDIKAEEKQMKMEDEQLLLDQRRRLAQERRDNIMRRLGRMRWDVGRLKIICV